MTSFSGHGKKTVWEIWRTFNEVTPAFCILASIPTSVDDQLQILEHFVVLLYDRVSTEEKVNRAWKQLFYQKGRTMDDLPPTQAAFLEHIKRAAYQAGHISAQMFIAVPKVPSPGDWGWL